MYRNSCIPSELPQGLRKGKKLVKETISGSTGRRYALAACWADKATRLSHQLQAEPKREQPNGEDSVGWTCIGQPVGDITVLLYRKVELSSAPGIQGTKLKDAHLAAVRLQQGAAQGFGRDITIELFTCRINLFTGTATIEKGTEQNSISANLLQFHKVYIAM